MKAEELTDITLQEPNSQIVIELPNGQRLATQDYTFDLDKRGNNIIVVRAGRKLMTKQSKKS